MGEPTHTPLTRSDMKIGGYYNFRGQPERLRYLGRNWSGNGYWHQFCRVGQQELWSEILDGDLHMLEETTPDKLGILPKFVVRRADGSSRVGERHFEEWTFVLTPQTCRFSRSAVRHYAKECASNFPVLSAELVAKMDEFDRLDGERALREWAEELDRLEGERNAGLGKTFESPGTSE
jgi:hypothetical protein